MEMLVIMSSSVYISGWSLSKGGFVTRTHLHKEFQ